MVNLAVFTPMGGTGCRCVAGNKVLRRRTSRFTIFQIIIPRRRTRLRLATSEHLAIRPAMKLLR